MISENLRSHDVFHPRFTAPTEYLEKRLEELITTDPELLIEEWQKDPNNEWKRQRGIKAHEALSQDVNNLMAELYRRTVFKHN